MFLLKLLLIVEVCRGMETEVKGVRREICPWQRFKANCADDNKITIRSAVYGLMGNKRCLRGNETLILYNCSTDVHNYVIGRCSERNYCEIEMPDNELDRLSVNNCPKSTLQYLEIVYDCQKSPNCPTYIPPVGAIAEYTNEGYRVFCNDSKVNTWNVSCVQGHWTPNLVIECKDSEEGGHRLFIDYGLPCLLAIICVSSFMLSCIIWKRCNAHGRQFLGQFPSTDAYTIPSRQVSIERDCYRETDAVRSENTSAMESQSDERVYDTLEDSTHRYSIAINARYSGIQSLENDVSSFGACGNDDPYLYATVRKGLE